MEFLTIAGIGWVSLGLMKAVMFVSTIPQMMNWHVWYKTEDEERARHGFRERFIVASVLAILATVFLVAFGGVLLLLEGRKFFHSYGDAWIAAMGSAATGVKVGVMPFFWESWEDYQERIGHDPAAVANALEKMSERGDIPKEIQDVIDTAKELQDMQNRDVPNLTEDDEWNEDEKKDD
jgi:hypothetical protein